jgi:serine/threonine protein kinase
MPENDVPGTLETEHEPVFANPSQQSTAAAENSAAAEALPVLDLRGYELIERLGGGGMGDVYRAADPALGRDLAVKVMKEGLRLFPSAQSRFLREARVTGSLQHPGIVPIYNLGRLADGRLHYTMRLVRGRTFADILREEAGRPERLPRLLTIFDKVCQAVAYAHSKRVLHRDLKPANVMVGRFGEVQVMDWGLAKVLEAGERGCVSAPSEPEEGGTRIHTEAGDTPLEQTRMGREMGTPAYMPPEQALGEWDTVDERADVFALGAILCEILTGQPPYSGCEMEEALRRARRGDLTEAWARLGGCGADAALLSLCRECLAPMRENRPRDAEQVAQRVAAYELQVQDRLRRAELERAAAVVKAAEERKRRRWMRAALLLLFVGAAVSAWQAVRATNAEGRAREKEGQALAAAEAERQAKDLATMRLTQIEKANDVLTSIFRDLDPRSERKGEPGLRQQLSQHLQRAAKQLDEETVGDPATAARLQTALAESLINLGQTKLAMELLTKAGMTLESQLGADHPDTLDARNHLATAYLDDGRTADAIRLYEQTLKQREARLGPDHLDTIISRSNLAIAYRLAGRTAEAIQLYEQTLKLAEAKLGPDHRQTLHIRNNLAIAYDSAGRTTDAIRLHEQILKQREAQLGPEHPHTILSRNNLAEAYRAAGRTSDAILLLEQTVQQFESKLGPDHPHTLVSRNNLALAYDQAGRTAEAIRLYEQILKQREARFGPEHPDTLASRNNLAAAYWSAGRSTEAIRLLEQTLKQREEQLGPDHPDTLGSRNNLAATYKAVGRTTEAIRLHEQNLKQYEAKLGPDHPSTLTSRNNLAQTYREAGRNTDAIRLHEQNLKRCEAKLGIDHPDTLLSMANLGEAYRDANRIKEALALLETVIERGRKRSGGLPALVSWAPGALAETYERAGRFAKAESIFRDACKLSEQKFGSDDRRTASAFAQLGVNLLKQKKYSEAEPLLRQCLTIRVNKQPDAWTTFNTRSTLGEALMGQKKYTEAQTMLLQGYQGMKQRQDKIPAAYRQLRLSEALERLVRLYEATDQKEKAADWQKKLDEAKAAKK